MSNIAPSRSKQKLPLHTLPHTLNHRNALSINKLPTSHIPNGNTTLYKPPKTSSKVEPLLPRPPVTTPLKINKDHEAKEGAKVEKTPFNSWIRPNNEDRHQMAWGARPSVPSKDTLAS